MRDTIGIRDLKNMLSSVLRRVRKGETVIVTDRNQPVAILIPAASGNVDTILDQLVKAGCLSWAGGKPAGCRNPPKVRGLPVSDAVLEDRR